MSQPEDYESFVKKVEKEVAEKMVGPLGAVLNDDVAGVVAGFVSADRLPTANEMLKVTNLAEDKWATRAAQFVLECATESARKMESEFDTNLADLQRRLEKKRGVVKGKGKNASENDGFSFVIHKRHWEQQRKLMSALSDKLVALGYDVDYQCTHNAEADGFWSIGLTWYL